jgi:predicted nucleotide-binding protein
VGSLEDYLLAEGGRLWGRPLSTGIPLQDGPIGDDLAFPQTTGSPTRDVNAAPEPSGSPTEPSASTAPAQGTAPQGAQTQPSAAHDTPSVFISYAHEDEVIAHALGDGLAQTGHQVWIDRNELLAGDSIIEQISEAVAGIDFFCALVSEASRESRWCKHELSLAMTSDLGREGTIVIPIRVGDVTMPESIADKLYIQLDPADVTATVERITDDVRRHRNRRHEIGNAPELRADSESDRTTRLGEVPAADSSELTPAREARHLTEDMRRWLRDRDRVLQSATAVTPDEMNARGAFHSSIHLAAQAELRHQALHEYRDEISRKRRRYQELRDAPIGGSELPRFELDDGSREILARWRAPVTVPGMDDHLSVDDPTDLALEPGLREFERRGDGPEDNL